MAGDWQITHNKDINARNKFSPGELEVGNPWYNFDLLLILPDIDVSQNRSKAKQQNEDLGIMKLRFWGKKDSSSSAVTAMESLTSVTRQRQYSSLLSLVERRRSQADTSSPRRRRPPPPPPPCLIKQRHFDNLGS